jgi:hypothetical protein
MLISAIRILTRDRMTSEVEETFRGGLPCPGVRARQFTPECARRAQVEGSSKLGGFRAVAMQAQIRTNCFLRR